IGIDATGTVALHNAIGVDVHLGDVIIGGSAMPAGTPPGNVISGNTSDGVRFLSDWNSHVTIHGSLIGTNAEGTAAVPNGAHGVFSNRFSELSRPGYTTVGGTQPGEGNVIAFNALDGIATSSGFGLFFVLDVRSNSIHSNAGLGIDRSDNDVTPNTPGNPF